MEEEVLYLKPNVVIEPLVMRWYAWTHLFSPATAAMNVTGRHLKIMNSYIQAAHVHAAAVRNPKMLGGPFMDYGGGRVHDVVKLRDETIEKQKDLIDLSDAIVALDRLLKEHAQGYSLESLYGMVPENLKGYVELVYDLNNNPSYRLYEGLLYQSKFYRKDLQSIALWKTKNDERPFCLSTARLDDPHVLNIDIPLDHAGIDAMSRMKRTPGSVSALMSQLGIPDRQEQLFRSFFTADVPRDYERYTGDKIRMRYFGHACILLETKDVAILVDPLISYYGYQSSLDHFSDVDLPDVIDYVLITHNHQDHILFETLLPLRHKIKNLIVPRSSSGALQDPNLKLVFQSLGFTNIIEIDEFEEVKFGNCTVTGVPFTGEHSDLNIRAKICFHVKISDFALMLVADSRIVERKLYEHIGRTLGHINVLFLGMECDGAPLSWLYGPLLTAELPRDKDQSRRLSGSNCEKGMHLVDIFRPSEVYVYAMGQEPWLEFISTVRYSDDSNPIVQSNILIEECKSRGIVAERLYGEKEILYNYKLSIDAV